jgi:hypothetical protein
MPFVTFEPTIPASERAKTALDRSATVTGYFTFSSRYLSGTDRTENISSIIACTLVAGEST